MDFQLELWLKEVDLGHLYDVFIKNGFNRSALLLATEDHFKELVPLIGERLRLMDLLKRKREFELSSLTTSPSADTIILPDDQKFFVLNDRGFELCDEVITENVDDCRADSSIASDDVTRSNVPIKRKAEDSSENDIEIYESIFFMENKTLKEFLMNNSFGNAILTSYETKKELDPTSRKMLVRIIIDGILNRHCTVNSKMFASLSNSIIILFPTEKSEMYYFQRNTGKRLIKGGKLIDRYRNQKKFLSRNSSANVTLDVEDNAVKDNEKVVWLKTSVSPWSKVLQYWNDTRDVRFTERLSPSPAYKMVESWPILKNDIGYTLVIL